MCKSRGYNEIRKYENSEIQTEQKFVEIFVKYKAKVASKVG